MPLIKYRVLFGFFAALTSVSIQAETPRLEWTVTAASDGTHNAFTDLIQWKDAYYLCFRSGSTHGSMDGEIRVMTSADMKAWSPRATIDTWGDDRDPHFVSTDEQLIVYFGTWDLKHMPGTATPDRGSVRSYMSTSNDGKKWTAPKGVYDPGFWLWRVRRHDGVFYSGAYTAVRPTPEMRETRLLRSSDGLNWELVSVVTKDRMAGEADIVWDAAGQLRMLSRTGDTAGDAAWYTPDADLKTWQSTPTGVRLHAPAFAQWKDRLFVSGRDHAKNSSTNKLWEVEGEKLVELLTLPSGGDTSYPGLIVDPTSADAKLPALFITWYSQHEIDRSKSETKNASNVYAGRIIFE